MTQIADLYMYLVTNGTATLDSDRASGAGHADEMADWIDSVAVLALNESDAVALADQYDRGEIDPGMHIYMGRIVLAIRGDM